MAPALIVVPPEYVFVPEGVKVLAPVFTTDPPTPVIAPANVVSDELAIVKIFPAVATVVPAAALARLLRVAPVVVPVTSTIAVPLNVTLLEEAIAPEPERARVPAETEVAPV
jgi:hypothetical protein